MLPAAALPSKDKIAILGEDVAHLDGRQLAAIPDDLHDLPLSLRKTGQMCLLCHACASLRDDYAVSRIMATYCSLVKSQAPKWPK
jgi:hypothetical protein